MKRALLGLSLTLSLACGGLVDSARREADRKLNEAKRQAADQVQESLERELVEFVAEKGLDAELLELGAYGSRIETEQLDLATGVHAKIPGGFPVQLPEGATLRGVATADADEQLAHLVFADLKSPEDAVEAYRGELMEAGWTLAEADAGGETKGSALAATRGEGERLVFFATDDASLTIMWTVPKKAGATSPEP